MATAQETIRRARPGDALALKRLLAELGYAPAARALDEAVNQVVRHPEAAVFVACVGLEVVGFVALSHRPQLRLAGRLATVDELVVADAQRGRGVGGRLLDAAVAHARGLGCVRVELTQRRTRESYERGFYTERGFVEVDSAVLRRDL